MSSKIFCQKLPQDAKHDLRGKHGSKLIQRNFQMKIVTSSYSEGQLFSQGSYRTAEKVRK